VEADSSSRCTLGVMTRRVTVRQKTRPSVRPVQQKFNKTNTAPKYLYSSAARVSGPVIAATKNNKGAFLKALETEMKYLMQDTKRAFNRQLHGDGRDVLGFYKTGAPVD
jgi:hypothetical protein